MMRNKASKLYSSYQLANLKNITDNFKSICYIPWKTISKFKGWAK